VDPEPSRVDLSSEHDFDSDYPDPSMPFVVGLDHLWEAVDCVEREFSVVPMRDVARSIEVG
jgi:hypothetical protein